MACAAARYRPPRHGLAPKKGARLEFSVRPELTAKICPAREVLSYGFTVFVRSRHGPGGLHPRAAGQWRFRGGGSLKRSPLPAFPLAEISESLSGRLELVRATRLKIDLRRCRLVRLPKIVANLPYNVGTQLLINLG